MTWIAIRVNRCQWVDADRNRWQARVDGRDFTRFRAQMVLASYVPTTFALTFVLALCREVQAYQRPIARISQRGKRLCPQTLGCVPHQTVKDYGRDSPRSSWASLAETRSGRLDDRLPVF